jgi:hypothetical protein
MSTSFLKKCEILAEVHVEAGSNPNLEDFRIVNDVGLPLAYLIAQDLVEPKGDDSLKYIDDTWRMLCESLGIDPNGDYKDSADFLSHQEKDEDDEDDD